MLFKVSNNLVQNYRSFSIRGKNDCCLSCKRVGGIWYESECMFWDNLNGGMNVCFGIATSSCEILYNMTRRASALITSSSKLLYIVSS
jgi:hypothetical protein